MHERSDKLVFGLTMGVYMLAIGAMLYAGWQRRIDDAESEGRRLVTDVNCADCAEGSEEGLREGIALLEKSVESRPETEVEPETVRALAEGYNTLLHVHLEPNEPEYAETQAKLVDVQEWLYTIQTDDPAILYEYAATVSDGDEQAALFREVTRLDPTFAPAHYALGSLLYDRGETDLAIEEFKAAVRHAEPLDETSYYVRLLQVLKAESRLDEADEFSERFNEETLPAELFQQDSPQ